MNESSSGKRKLFIHFYKSTSISNYSSSDGSSDASWKICLIMILSIVSIILSFVVYRFWEWPVFFWILTFSLAIDYIVIGDRDKIKKFNCGNCGYLKCTERGINRQLKFCTRWAQKPIQNFRLILWTTFFGVLLLIYLLGISLAGKIFTLIIWVCGLSIVGVLWIDKLRFGAIPHAYDSPPNHPNSCRCGGTGSCPNCSSNKRLQSYSISYSTSSYHSVCPSCKGTTLCPTEIQKVAPELLEGRSNLILYSIIFMIIGYIIAGLLLDYFFVYGGYF